MNIDTDRLVLVALTCRQLKLWLEDLPALEGELDCCYQAEPLEGDFREIVKGQYARVQQAPLLYWWRSFFFLIRKADRVVIGAADFKDAPSRAGEVEIGYGLGAAFEQQGYMSEAIAAMSNWALCQPEVSCITAETEKHNEPSQRVLTRCGFKKYCEQDTIWWRYSL